MKQGQTNKGSFKKNCIPWNKGVKGYNKGHPSYTLGKHWKLNQETKDKIGRANSISLKGKILPQTVKDKISKANKGKVPKVTYQKGEKHPNWKGGISNEPYGQEFNKELKEKVRKKYNYRCQECFRHQNELYRKGSKYSLIVHHIDFNKKNNQEDNLIPLCLECHSQTNFNRQNWINHFQGKII